MYFEYFVILFLNCLTLCFINISGIVYIIYLLPSITNSQWVNMDNKLGEIQI